MDESQRERVRERESEGCMEGFVRTFSPTTCFASSSSSSSSFVNNQIEVDDGADPKLVKFLFLFSSLL